MIEGYLIHKRRPHISYRRLQTWEVSAIARPIWPPLGLTNAMANDAGTPTSGMLRRDRSVFLLDKPPRREGSHTEAEKTAEKNSRNQ
jgi:hypothetical protein